MPHIAKDFTQGADILCKFITSLEETSLTWSSNSADILLSFQHCDTGSFFLLFHTICLDLILRKLEFLADSRGRE